MKVYKQWKEAEAMLTRKRETKARLELNHKSDKIPQADTEIREVSIRFELGIGELVIYINNNCVFFVTQLQWRQSNFLVAVVFVSMLH